MNILRFLMLSVVAAVPLIVACGGDDSPRSDASATTPGGAPSGASTTVAGGSTTKRRDPASVDVCALLPKADAEAAADVIRQRDGRGTGTKYNLTATKQTYTGAGAVSGCKFVFDQVDSDGYRGVTVIEVISADDFKLYASDGKKVLGLGDEAVSVRGTTVVRVGDLMLQAGENTFTESFIVELFRKMAPRLK